MHDNDVLTLLSDRFPGFTEDRSIAITIAITYESGTKMVRITETPGLSLNRDFD